MTQQPTSASRPDHGAVLPGTTPMHHVDHIVYVVHHENVARYVDQLSELFRTRFDHKDGPKLEGSNLHVYVSWDTGLELVAPVESDDAPEKGRTVLDHLARYGEAPFAVVTRVPDIHGFSDRARGLGYQVSDVIQPGTAEERRPRYGYTPMMDDVQETFLSSFCGTWLLAGELEYSPEHFSKPPVFAAEPGTPPMNHLDHVLYVVHPQNVDRYVTQLSELFDTTFEHKDGPKLEGSNYHVHISWDTGLELVSLEPSPDAPANARILAEHLERHGESLFGVVLRVPDLDEFAEHARSLGYDVSDVIQRGDEADRRAALSFTTKVTDVRERFVTQVLSHWMLAGELDYAAAGGRS